jgi:hypothetical protein
MTDPNSAAELKDFYLDRISGKIMKLIRKKQKE